MLIAPGHQNGEYAVAPGDGLADDLAVIRRAGNDGDAPFEGIEFADALLPAGADHLVAPVPRVLHHVPAELPGSPNYADFHRL